MKIPLCILFADDIVSVDGNRDDLHAKLERYRERLDSGGFRQSAKCTIRCVRLVM